MKIGRREKLLLGVASALGLAWVLTGPPDEAPDAIPPPPAVMTGAAAPASDRTMDPGGAIETDSSAGPAPGTPESPASKGPMTLLDELPGLEQRLAHGDFAAGWQAHRKLRECHFRATAAASAGAVAQDLAQQWQRKNLELRESWRDEQSDHYCAGSATTAARRAFDLLLRMAEMGDLKAQVQFTLDPPFFRRQALAELDLILIYRERAPALLERALRAGSRRALTALLDAHTPALQQIEEDMSVTYHSPSSPVEPAHGAPGYRLRFGATISYRELPHRQILEPDPATAYRLALICQRACVHSNHLDRANRTIAAVEGSLDAATRLRLSSEANALLLDAFARPVDEAPVTAGYWWNAQ
ncbi:MAG: hypothetical protein JNL89_15045 [Rhodanobacteraceae bacterium]|nr:hypothetical protein [Rhodanobacteraceae bacterium]